MATKNIDKRRKVRALEAKRDSHLTRIAASKLELKKVRTELATVRRGR